jgi:DNA topoisomerase VI subunit B
MEYQKNKESNRYNLQNYLAISAFNSVSTHEIKIKINGKMFFEKKLTKNKEHHLKISDYFDYKNPSTNTIEIIWNGDKEDEKKFLKLYTIVVNNQHIQPHTSMITPIQSEYIKNLLSTEQGVKFYRKKILNPGHHHGWYGTYRFRFLIDHRQMEDFEHVSLIESTGIIHTSIHTDPNKIKYYRKADKK